MEQGTLSIAVVELEEKEPPNPKGRDRNDMFSLANVKDFGTRNSASWIEWWAVWV